MVGELECLIEPESYAGWSLAPGRATHAGHVKGEGPDEQPFTSPPGWGLGIGLTTLSNKTPYITETATEKSTTTVCDGPPESLQEARVYGGGESRKEATDRKMEVLNAKSKTRIGFWNLWTMYETDKLVQVKAEQWSQKWKIRNYNWGTIEKLAKDRQKWKSSVAALHASGHDG